MFLLVDQAVSRGYGNARNQILESNLVLNITPAAAAV